MVKRSRPKLVGNDLNYEVDRFVYDGNHKKGVVFGVKNRVHVSLI